MLHSEYSSITIKLPHVSIGYTCKIIFVSVTAVTVWFTTFAMLQEKNHIIKTVETG